MLRKLKLPADLNCSKTVGPKGSYRAEHVLDFLGRWLEPWSEERAARNDIRILYSTWIAIGRTSARSSSTYAGCGVTSCSCITGARPAYAK